VLALQRKQRIGTIASTAEAYADVSVGTMVLGVLDNVLKISNFYPNPVSK
jgi:hypothetical protein